ncbi:acetolactate decarboxylase [Flavobacterium sp. LC2016-23]|uniref:acetolactate decarboxylase n=1 Tax=Flavobacterium sp. LC2016-23 TaxID=2666330 RepID=UPI0012AFC971|nr:acetolactate decarboxylase [Flavobacterium sp. LC2016-23]MRX41360.1 acetolactate decarboxylase [Flavobacterium sp. LC2016-23]
MRTTHTVLILLLCVTGFVSVRGQVQKEEFVFHYSVMDALRNGVYKGDITVKELKNKGNFGLGTYNFLDGEMVVLDGVFYRIPSDGKVTKAEPEREVPFACLAVFSADNQYEMSGIATIEALQNEIRNRLPSSNKPYALRIECSFDSIVVGSAAKLEAKDTTGLAELMKTRPLYQKEHISGTMVGFYTPPSFSAVDLSPFHFHFIAVDKTFGGHFISGVLAAAKIKISIDEKSGYEIVLPKQNKTFDKPWPQQSAIKSVY